MKIVLLIFFLAICAILIGRFALHRVTIFEYQAGLKYLRGRFSERLPAGVYWYSHYFSSIKTVDLRPVAITIPGQEVLSADSVGLKVSLAVKYQIVDPAAAINKVQDYSSVLYQELQVAVRTIIGSAPIDQLLERREQFSTRLMELTESKIREVGIQLPSANIKDIMFPAR